jgi:DNA invertase Pin-like site-specific DNA recombinase
MFDRKYDPKQPYRFVRYGRMSGSKQNKRSPDQQFATINETIYRCGYPWQCIVTYRDDAISGRYLRKRPGFQQMLRDIEARIIQVDLIAVDTLERLGRADEIAERRRKLFVEYGVLIVAADNNFADPTGVVGKAVGMVEQIRSTEYTRVSRHNVIRGKKDAARRGRWTGGPRPFGCVFKPMIDNSVSPPEGYNVLEHEPREAAALRLLFERADATGEGDTRLAQWWNSSDEIPKEFKEISAHTVGYRLENPIAIGTLRWGENRTAVVNDTRVTEHNPDGAELIPNFCPAIVGVELYERVQRLRRARAAQIKRSRQPHGSEGNGKFIAPQAPGLTLKYLLSGLVRCSVCNSSLRPVPSGRLSKGGRRYVYYACPRYCDGSCNNKHHVPEDRLRQAVIARLRARLFPLPAQGKEPSWLPELLPMIRQEQERYRAFEPERAAAEEKEMRALEEQLAGWSMSLGNPQLAAVVRNDIEVRYAEGKQRLQDLQQRASARKALEEHIDKSLNVQAVLEALQQLDKILAGQNPTVGNLELCKHIDVITAYPEGRVEMRGTMLGLFEGAVDLLCRGAEEREAGGHEANGFTAVVPRRRGRLHLPSLSAEAQGLVGGVELVLDPKRFAGLPEGFFWTEPIQIDGTSCWSEQNAAAVARLRLEGKTHEQLAAHFKVSVPTIRKALKLAVKADPSLKAPRKMPRPCWAKDHASEVARLKAEGLSIIEIGKRLGKSEPTIRAALEHAQSSASRGAATA